jgi:hypothetical protein
MQPVKAKLVKRQSDDGFCGVEDNVPIGTEYVIDLDSKRTVGLVHVPCLLKF